MEFFDVIKKRYSIRNYKKCKIPTNHMKKIIEAARLAPSGGNMQPWNLVIVSDPKILKAIQDIIPQRHIVNNISIIVAAVCNPRVAGTVNFGKIKTWDEVDAAIALTHITLAATSLGYGSCWLGCYEMPQVKNILRIPDDKVLLALLAVGKPAPASSSRGPSKKPIKELFSNNFYGNQLKI